MLSEKIINIDYKKIGEAIQAAEEPKVIIMSDDTLLACLADEPDYFEETESDMGSSFSLQGITISLNQDYDFGYVVIK